MFISRKRISEFSVLFSKVSTRFSLGYHILVVVVSVTHPFTTSLRVTLGTKDPNRARGGLRMCRMVDSYPLLRPLYTMR